MNRLTVVMVLQCLLVCPRTRHSKTRALARLMRDHRLERDTGDNSTAIREGMDRITGMLDVLLQVNITEHKH